MWWEISGAALHNSNPLALRAAFRGWGGLSYRPADRPSQ